MLLRLQAFGPHGEGYVPLLLLVPLPENQRSQNCDPYKWNLSTTPNLSSNIISFEQLQYLHTFCVMAAIARNLTQTSALGFDLDCSANMNKLQSQLYLERIPQEHVLHILGIIVDMVNFTKMKSIAWCRLMIHNPISLGLNFVPAGIIHGTLIDVKYSEKPELTICPVSKQHIRKPKLISDHKSNVAFS